MELMTDMQAFLFLGCHHPHRRMIQYTGSQETGVTLPEYETWRLLDIPPSQDMTVGITLPHLRRAGVRFQHPQLPADFGWARSARPPRRLRRESRAPSALRAG